MGASVGRVSPKEGSRSASWPHRPAHTKRRAGEFVRQPVAPRGFEHEKQLRVQGELSHAPDAFAGRKTKPHVRVLPHHASHLCPETTQTEARGLSHQSLVTTMQPLPGCASSGDLPSKNQEKPPLLFTQLPQEKEAKNPHGSGSCSWSDGLPSTAG